MQALTFRGWDSAFTILRSQLCLSGQHSQHQLLKWLFVLQTPPSSATLPSPKPRARDGHGITPTTAIPSAAQPHALWAVRGWWTGLCAHLQGNPHTKGRWGGQDPGHNHTAGLEQWGFPQGNHRNTQNAVLWKWPNLPSTRAITSAHLPAKNGLELIPQLPYLQFLSFLFLLCRNNSISLFFLVAKFLPSLMGIISMRKDLSDTGNTAYVLLDVLLCCKLLYLVQLSRAWCYFRHTGDLYPDFWRHRLYLF